MRLAQARLLAITLFISVVFFNQSSFINSSSTFRFGNHRTQENLFRAKRAALSPSSKPSTNDQSIRTTYSKLPLRFEVNRGQTASAVQFISRSKDSLLYLTDKSLLMTLKKPVNHTSLKMPAPTDQLKSAQATGASLCMEWIGSNPKLKAEGIRQTSGTSNYFLGNDPKKWRTNIPNFSQVLYKEVYSGIDLIFYGKQQQLEYDFRVAAGADPNLIRLQIRGAKKIYVDANGDLILQTEIGEIRQAKPVVYQESKGSKQFVDGNYRIERGTEISFQVGKYDTNQALVIDPILSYSTYLGGDPADIAYGVAVDAAGNAYVTGITNSLRFPTTDRVPQPSRPQRDEFGLSAFVTKLNAEGTGIIYSTYLGGTDFDDLGYGIAVDSEGNAYVTGEVGSTDFPTTPDAFKTKSIALTEGFVTKLSPTGDAMVYSTLVGGNRNNPAGDRDNIANAIAVDSAGRAYVVGETSCIDFRTTNDAPQPNYAGGRRDAFVRKFNRSGSDIVYSSYLGGKDSDVATGIALDPEGNAYVTGYTLSGNFPITSGAFQATNHGADDIDAFVTKINASGTKFVYSSYLGSSGDDFALGVAADQAGSAYVTGATESYNTFPTTPGAFQSVGGFLTDGFVSKFSADGSELIYSTYLGGRDDDLCFSIKTDAMGFAYVTGEAKSINFPITEDALQPTHSGSQLFKSADAAVQWGSMHTGMVANPLANHAPAVERIIIDPLTPSTLYAINEGKLNKSTDGGNRWQAVPVPAAFTNLSFLAFALDPLTPSTLYVGSYGGVLKSTDSGMTWKEYRVGLEDLYISSLALDPKQTATIYASISQRSRPLSRSTDGGETWKPVNTGLSASDFTAVIFDPSSSSTIYAVAFYGGILKSTDSGSSWALLNTALSDFNFTGLVIDPQNPATMYAATLGDGVLKSTDAGVTWRSTNQGLTNRIVRVIAIDPLQPATLYAGTRSGVFKSTNSGDSWEAANQGLTSGSVFAIAIDPINSSTLYVGTASENRDAFVIKLNPQGSALSYSTFFGGSTEDAGLGLALDSSGNVYVVGSSNSPDLPTSAQAFQPTMKVSLNRFSAFVTKIGGLRDPKILEAFVKSNKLIVTGENFDAGAIILLDGEPQKTFSDEPSSGTKLIAKKAGQKIATGQAVKLQVRNRDGALSNEFSFTRP